MSDYYVYVIFYPCIGGQPCYVGKGKGDRVNTHVRYTHNDKLEALMIKHDGKLPKSIIAKDLTEAQAFELEMQLIVKFGRIPEGPLFNLTDGGEGISGAKRPPVSEETRKRISNSQIGKKLSDEHRNKICLRLKGRVFTPEHRAKVNKTKKEKPQYVSPETREKIRQSSIAYWNDPANKEKISQERLKGWTDERREKMSAKRKGEGWSPARRAAHDSSKISESQRKRWTPEQKEKFSKEKTGKPWTLQRRIIFLTKKYGYCDQDMLP